MMAVSANEYSAPKDAAVVRERCERGVLEIDGCQQLSCRGPLAIGNQPQRKQHLLDSPAVAYLIGSSRDARLSFSALLGSSCE